MPKLGKLDDKSLELKEFNRRKKGTQYKNDRITDYVDSGRFARVYAVEGMFGGKLGGRLTGKNAAPKYALRFSDDDRSEKDEQKPELSRTKGVRSGQRLPGSPLPPGLPREGIPPLSLSM